MLHGDPCVCIGAKYFGGMHFDEMLIGGKRAEEGENL
jgi:hypothetical protein